MYIFAKCHNFVCVETILEMLPPLDFGRVHLTVILFFQLVLLMDSSLVLQPEFKGLFLTSLFHV